MGYLSAEDMGRILLSTTNKDGKIFTETASKPEVRVTAPAQRQFSKRPTTARSIRSSCWWERGRLVRLERKAESVRRAAHAARAGRPRSYQPIAANFMRGLPSTRLIIFLASGEVLR
jgi:hypothetical protein